MATDPLEQVLRLVAEGRLTAEEAAPILAALDDAPSSQPAGTASGRSPGGAAGGAADRPGAGAADRPVGGAAEPPTGAPDGPAPTSLRLEVRESGRQVVNLRLPIAVGRLALDRVPGLSGDQVERVRDALRTGMRGPILLVEDGDSVVQIVLE